MSASKLRCPCCRLLFLTYNEWLSHYKGSEKWLGCRYYSDKGMCPWCAYIDPKRGNISMSLSFKVTGTSICWCCFNELDEFTKNEVYYNWEAAKSLYGTPTAYAYYSDYYWAYKKWWTDSGKDPELFDYTGHNDFRNYHALLKLGFPFSDEEKKKLEADIKADRESIIAECNAQVAQLNPSPVVEESDKVKVFIDSDSKRKNFNPKNK